MPGVGEPSGMARASAAAHAHGVGGSKGQGARLKASTTPTVVGGVSKDKHVQGPASSKRIKANEPIAPVSMRVGDGID